MVVRCIFFVSHCDIQKKKITFESNQSFCLEIFYILSDLDLCRLVKSNKVLEAKTFNVIYQAIPWYSEAGTQTEWKYPRNANTQYYPREYTEQEQEELGKSNEMGTFLTGVCPR